MYIENQIDSLHITLPKYKTEIILLYILIKRRISCRFNDKEKENYWTTKLEKGIGAEMQKISEYDVVAFRNQYFISAARIKGLKFEYEYLILIMNSKRGIKLHAHLNPESFKQTLCMFSLYLIIR